MAQEAPKRKIEPFARNCNYRYLLHIDGNVASSRLASELHVGSTIFKQDSFSYEYFYPLLRCAAVPSCPSCARGRRHAICAPQLPTPSPTT